METSFKRDQNRHDRECALPRIKAGRATNCVERAISPAPTGLSRRAGPIMVVLLRRQFGQHHALFSRTGPYPGGIDPIPGARSPAEQETARPCITEPTLGRGKPHRHVMLSKAAFFPGTEHRSAAVRSGNLGLLPPGYGVKTPHFMRQSTEKEVKLRRKLPSHQARPESILIQHHQKGARTEC